MNHKQINALAHVLAIPNTDLSDLVDTLNDIFGYLNISDEDAVKIADRTADLKDIMEAKARKLMDEVFPD